MNDSDSDGEEEVEEEEVFRRLANVFQGSEHVSGQSSIGGVPITLFQKRKKNVRSTITINPMRVGVFVSTIAWTLLAGRNTARRWRIVIDKQ